MKSEKNKKNIFNVNSGVNKLVLSIIIIILLNVVAGFFYFRADLTRHNSYSLSGISEDVVKNLEEPLTIKVFFSDNLPAPYNSVKRYLEDILVEYKDVANRNFRYDFVDVDKQEGKQLAEDYGIYPIQVREIGDDQFKSRNAYMGLVLLHGDLIEKLNELTTDQGLEYKITTTIQKMISKVNRLVSLKSKIKMKLYVSSNLNGYNISQLDKLDDYVKKIYEKVNRKTYNQVEYAFVDPSKDNSISMIAEKYGLQKLTINKNVKGKDTIVDEALIGIVVEHEGKVQAVQLGIDSSIFGQYVVGGLENLEDRLNNAINLLLSDNPAVGYIEGHGEKAIDDFRNGAGSLKKLLSDMYEVKKVDLAKTGIPADVKTIIINGPQKEFTNEELFKVDQFVMQGGSVVFFVDSFNEVNLGGNKQMMMGGQTVYMPLKTGIEKLLASYGVTVNQDYVMDMNCFVARQRGMDEMNIYYIPMLEHGSFDKENVVSKYLKQILFIKGSSITLDDKFLKENKIDSHVLVRSSRKSWLMQGRINLNPLMIQPPVDESKYKRYNLLSLLEGKFTSYFNNKVPEFMNKKDGKRVIESDKIIHKGVKKARIIVSGSSEITGNNLIGEQGLPSNAALIHNMIDYLNGNDDIPEMRSKGLAANPLEKSSSTTRMVIKGVNIIGLPFLVMIIGLLIWRRRIKRQRKIQKRFSGGAING